jgi:hypothetical protein
MWVEGKSGSCRASNLPSRRPPQRLSPLRTVSGTSRTRRFMVPVWIKVESALRRHRKVIRLGRMLSLTDERTLVGGLVLLWLSARESAPDGDITSWKARDVAAAAGFDEQDADQFYLALHECGFLEGDNGKVFLHDWMDHNGKFTKDAERMRNVRARSRTVPNSPECSRLARAPGSGAGAVQEQEPTDSSTAVAMDVLELIPPDPKPSPKRDIQKQADRKDWIESFPLFWEDYPRKEARKDAEKVWVSLQPKDYSRSQEFFDEIIAGLEVCCKTWKREHGHDTKFVPLGATWLRGERWRDHAEEG